MMEREPLLKRFLHELEGPAWIAKRVEVLPQAIRAWASGDNQGCPDQSKIINPKVF